MLSLSAALSPFLSSPQAIFLEALTTLRSQMSLDCFFLFHVNNCVPIPARIFQGKKAKSSALEKS